MLPAACRIRSLRLLSLLIQQFVIIPCLLPLIRAAQLRHLAVLFALRSLCSLMLDITSSSHVILIEVAFDDFLNSQIQWNNFSVVPVGLAWIVTIVIINDGRVILLVLLCYRLRQEVINSFYLSFAPWAI